MINVIIFGLRIFLNYANTRSDPVESGESFEQIDLLILGLLIPNR